MQPSSISHRIPIIVCIIALFSVVSHGAIIDVLNQTSGSTSSNTISVPFDAGTIADKLVVQVSSEAGAGVPNAVTYNGVPLTQATARDQRFIGVWYLDNPYTGGSAPLVVDMSSISPVNGISVGAVSIVGAAPGASGPPVSTSNQINLTVTDANSFVLAGHASNGNGTVTPDSKLTNLYAVTSATGGWRANVGYENGVVVGARTYTFGNVGPDPRTGAAIFSPSGTRFAIGDLFTTGVNALGASLASGSGDPHYVLTQVPSLSTATDIIVGRDDIVPGPWINNLADSAWIGPDNGGILSGIGGNYAATTTFTLPANADLMSIILSGSWAADNSGLDILLNGNSLGAAGYLDALEITGGLTSYTDFTDFTIEPGAPFFQHGVNTLAFAWRNGTGSGDNPTGLRVGSLIGSYSISVPEPSTYVIFAILFGAAFLFRTRRQA